MLKNKPCQKCGALPAIKFGKCANCLPARIVKKLQMKRDRKALKSRIWLSHKEKTPALKRELRILTGKTYRDAMKQLQEKHNQQTQTIQGTEK